MHWQVLVEYRWRVSLCWSLSLAIARKAHNYTHQACLEHHINIVHFLMIYSVHEMRFRQTNASDRRQHFSVAHYIFDALQTWHIYVVKLILMALFSSMPPDSVIWSILRARGILCTSSQVYAASCHHSIINFYICFEKTVSYHFVIATSIPFSVITLLMEKRSLLHREFERNRTACFLSKTTSRLFYLSIYNDFRCKCV